MVGGLGWVGLGYFAVAKRWVGLGWVWLVMGWVGLGYEIWTHGHL